MSYHPRVFNIKMTNFFIASESRLTEQWNLPGMASVSFVTGKRISGKRFPKPLLSLLITMRITCEEFVNGDRNNFPNVNKPMVLGMLF